MTTTQQLDAEAERRTNEKYLRTGVFGGRTTAVEKGVVKRIQYFDHQGIKAEIKAQLIKEKWTPEN